MSGGNSGSNNSDDYSRSGSFRCCGKCSYRFHLEEILFLPRNKFHISHSFTVSSANARASTKSIRTLVVHIYLTGQNLSLETCSTDKSPPGYVYDSGGYQGLGPRLLRRQESHLRTKGHRYIGKKTILSSWFGINWPLLQMLQVLK